MIEALKIFKENLSTNVVLMAVFVKVAFEKELSIAFYPDLHVCVFFEIGVWPVVEYLKVIYERIKPAFSSCITYTLFVEIPRYLKIPLIDFCETPHIKIPVPKVQVA